MLLKLGSRGQEVGQLHQKLVEAGERIALGELKISIYGPSTEGAVKDYQASHLGKDGKPLAVDGQVGPKTLWALDNPLAVKSTYTVQGWKQSKEVPATVTAVVKAAVEDLGCHEDPDGSNNGPTLKKFKTLGRPWCALALSTWYSTLSGGSPFGTKAAVASIYDWAKKAGKLVKSAEALPGDVMIILRDSGRGHTGLIVSTPQDDKVCTVEGNASNAVRGLIRSLDSFTAVVRPYA